MLFSGRRLSGSASCSSDCVTAGAFQNSLLRERAVRQDQAITGHGRNTAGKER